MSYEFPLGRRIRTDSIADWHLDSRMHLVLSVYLSIRSQPYVRDRI